MLHIPSKGYAYVPAGAKLYMRPSMNPPEDVASWPTRIQRKSFPLSGNIKKVGRETYVLFGTWGGVTAIRLEDVEWKKEPSMGPRKAKSDAVVSDVRVDLDNGVTIRLLDDGGKQLGFASASYSYTKGIGADLSKSCATSHRILWRGQPPGRIGRISGISTVDKSIKGQGWGVWLYAELARLMWENYKVAVAADSCTGGKTSIPAKRVWDSSRLKQVAHVDGYVMLWKGGAPMPRPDELASRVASRYVQASGWQEVSKQEATGVPTF